MICVPPSLPPPTLYPGHPGLAPMSKIYLYAEILANIRQVSLYASLPSAKNEQTHIDLSADRKTLTLLHDGHRASLFLPTRIAGSSSSSASASSSPMATSATAVTASPDSGQNELSVRLEIADVAGLPAAADPATRRNEYPWPARDLSSETRMRCRVCEADVLNPDAGLSLWKDLPSEHWAEMMDLWHCHKPHPANGLPDSTAHAHAKGFAPSSKVKAVQGTGLVDISSFLLPPDDCLQIQKTLSTTKSAPRLLSCTKCLAFLGVEDEIGEGWSLHKSSLALKCGSKSSWESFPASIFVAAHLLSLIESQATRKFVVHHGLDEAEDALLLWVFNPDFLYCSSKKAPAAHRAMKIFYRSIAITHARQMLDDAEQNSTVDELSLPTPILEDLAATLIQSTELLPLSARTFKEWSVGLLDRFQPDHFSSEIQSPP